MISKQHCFINHRKINQNMQVWFISRAILIKINIYVDSKNRNYQRVHRYLITTLSMNASQKRH